METPTKKSLSKLTLAMMTVWSLVIVILVSLILWWNAGITGVPDINEQNASDRAAIQAILDSRYLENAHLDEDSPWVKIDTTVTTEATQNPAEFAEFLAHLTSEPAGLDESQLTFPDGDKIIFYGPLYLSAQDWESILSTLSLDGVRQINLTETDTGDRVTMFTSATYLDELPGEGVSNNDTEIFDRDTTFVPEEQAGLEDLQNIQKPVGVESLRHVVNYTTKDSKHNILFVADHDQVQEVENAVNKIQDAGISVPLVIAVQYAKDVDETPNPEAENPPEDTYKIQVMDNYFLPLQQQNDIPEEEAQAALEILSQSLPTDQAPHLTGLYLIPFAYINYPPYYALQGQPSPSMQESE